MRWLCSDAREAALGSFALLQHTKLNDLITQKSCIVTSVNCIFCRYALLMSGTEQSTHGKHFKLYL